MANDAATSLRNEYTIQLMKLPKKVRLLPEGKASHAAAHDHATWLTAGSVLWSATTALYRRCGRVAYAP